MRDSKSGKGTNVSVLQNVQSVSGSTQPRIQWVLGSFPRLQRPGRDVNHPPATRAEVKNE